MTFLPANSITSYIPTDVILPTEPEELRRVLDDILKKIIDATNDKDIGYYNDVEGVNGQKFFTPGDPLTFRNVYRKVVDCGALPNAGTTLTAHGITTNANTRFTRVYGCATNPGGAAINGVIPLPYVSTAALANGVNLFVNATNVSLTTGVDYSAYTTTFVVLEYVQF